MTKQEIKEKYEDQGYEYLGVRFERKYYNIGDEIKYSKSNIERADTREFPDFDTEDYELLPCAGGVCCYDFDEWEKHIDLEWSKKEGYSVYLIGGSDYFEGEDFNEWVMQNAYVLEIM